MWIFYLIGDNLVPRPILKFLPSSYSEKMRWGRGWIGETKLYSSFPNLQFFIEGCNKPLRLDVSGRSRGLLVFTKSHLPTRQLTKLKFPMDIQIIIFELN